MLLHIVCQLDFSPLEITLICSHFVDLLDMSSDTDVFPLFLFCFHWANFVQYYIRWVLCNAWLKFLYLLPQRLLLFTYKGGYCCLGSYAYALTFRFTTRGGHLDLAASFLSICLNMFRLQLENWPYVLV
jgi:hypothetical protein